MSDNLHELLNSLKQTTDGLIKAHKEMMRRLFGSGGTDDPDAGVRVPRNWRPPGRAGAIALEEPQDEVRVEAVGRRPA